MLWPLLLGYLMVLSFLTTVIILPHWIERAERVGFVGLDLNKPDEPTVAEMGGIVVVFVSVMFILVNIAIQTFANGDNLSLFILHPSSFIACPALSALIYVPTIAVAKICRL